MFCSITEVYNHRDFNLTLALQAHRHKISSRILQCIDIMCSFENETNFLHFHPNYAYTHASIFLGPILDIHTP